MKNRLSTILLALIALLRTPPKEKESIEAQKTNLDDLFGELETFEGDSELNDKEIRGQFDDLRTLCETSTPDPEFAEVPENFTGEKTKNKPEGEKLEVPEDEPTPTPAPTPTRKQTTPVPVAPKRR